MPGRIDALLAMLDRGRDSALLRYSIGSEFLAAGDAESAAGHFRSAVEQDPAYSAAWKALGRALTGLNRLSDAEDAYRRGIEVATGHGDVQAAKEMTVFLRRLARKRGEGCGRGNA